MLAVSHPGNKYQSVSCPGTQETVSENCSRNGDGDFFKKTHEASASRSYPPTDSSSDETLSGKKLKRKTGTKLLAEENVAPECAKNDAPEDAKNRAALLKYFKNANLTLRPQPIEDIETSSSAESGTFSYPDFLPAPYNTLDLQKMSLSKGDDWKLSFEPPLEGSLDKLVSRLVEMERLQHSTILKERTKDPSASPTMSNRPSSTKDVYHLKQLKAVDLWCPQAAFDGDFHSFGNGLQETDISKWTCDHCPKWNSGPVSCQHSKHLRASYSKCTKAPGFSDSSNGEARRPLSCCGSSTKIRSAVKTPSPNIPAAFSLPDRESSKCKLPRTRRKSYRNNVSLMGKPFSSHRLKSLSVLAKPKYSQVDHQ